MTYCPVCRGSCVEGAHRDFVFCGSCGIAIRKAETIADDRERTYGEYWVTKHNSDRNIDRKSDFIIKLVKKYTQGGRVLDIGCASGVLVDKLTKAGYTAEGIDWSENAISFAKSNMSGTFMVGDACLSSITGAAVYDMIVASHIVEHLGNPQGLLAGAKRLLKPESYLCIAVPNLLWCANKPPWRRISSVFDTDHVACYTYLGLVRLIAEAGFGISGVITRTHGIDLLTATCVAYYTTIRSRWKQSHLPVGDSNRLSGSQGPVQRVYEAVTSLPIFPMLMYPANRLSERGYRGMELIIIAKQGEIPN